MTWRDHTWEFTVSALSWIVALGAIVFVLAFIAHDAYKTRRGTARR
jgi:uncharacterized membrane protein YGL010W